MISYGELKEDMVATYMKMLYRCVEDRAMITLTAGALLRFKPYPNTSEMLLLSCKM